MLEPSTEVFCKEGMIFTEAKPFDYNMLSVLDTFQRLLGEPSLPSGSVNLAAKPGPFDIGVSGQIASGKTSFARELESRGFAY
ncbi:hypothetical protein ACC780_37770, partial [Rhizobium ruizarguesonis]